MAEGNFFTRLFGRDDNASNAEPENRIENISQIDNTESTGTALTDAVNFVAELQSYYFNDICKMQSDLLMQTLTTGEERFINKKIKQEQVALSEIDEILDSITQDEKEFHSSTGRKSFYSFYDDIEKAQLTTVQTKVFKTLTKLCSINTKQELENIIFDRLNQYKEAWDISEEIEIPKNFNVILISGDEQTETYRFGEFCKTVNASDNDIVLTSNQLDKIRNLDFAFESSFPTDTVWVYVSNATRLQLNFMRRTSIVNNTWENFSNDNLSFDIVKLEDLDQYLKGILQIVFTKNAYAIISIVIPTHDMIHAIGPTEIDDDKVEICKKIRFILQERSGIYGDHLLTARISRKDIPETLQFISYLEFKSIYF